MSERDVNTVFLNQKRGKFLQVEIDPYSLGSVDVPKKGEEPPKFNIEGKEYNEILVPLGRRIDISDN